jgi:hypothetical protein
MIRLAARSATTAALALALPGALHLAPAAPWDPAGAQSGRDASDDHSSAFNDFGTRLMWHDG